MGKTKGMEPLARNIAGEIVMSDKPGEVMRKWREIFGIRQREIATSLNISPSVISDYESGRRKSPGVEFVRRFVKALLSENFGYSSELIEKFSEIEKGEGAILSIREFLSPINCIDFINTIHGKVIAGNNLRDIELWGYTVIDSIRAILEMSQNEFVKLYGLTPDRALIFTKVHLGRSPMIAIKVTKPRPKLIALHGLHPNKVDKLAVKIAKSEKIPLVVSRLRTEEELIENLNRLR